MVLRITIHWEKKKEEAFSVQYQLPELVPIEGALFASLNRCTRGGEDAPPPAALAAPNNLTLLLPAAFSIMRTVLLPIPSIAVMSNDGATAEDPVLDRSTGRLIDGMVPGIATAVLVPDRRRMLGIFEHLAQLVADAGEGIVPLVTFLFRPYALDARA